jgi:hypothetical protein
MRFDEYITLYLIDIVSNIIWNEVEGNYVQTKFLEHVKQRQREREREREVLYLTKPSTAKFT